jgi:hypothetical protein
VPHAPVLRVGVFLVDGCRVPTLRCSKGWENDCPIQPAAQYFSQLVRTCRNTSVFEHLASNPRLTCIYLYDIITYVRRTCCLSAFCHSPRPVRCLFYDSLGPPPISNSLCLLQASFEQKSGEQKSAKPRESCQASQNEHLQKSSHNSREMNTYIKKGEGGGCAMRLGRTGVAATIPLHSHSCATHTRNSRRIKLLQKKWGVGGPLDLGSDPFAITTDRAMISVP